MWCLIFITQIVSLAFTSVVFVSCFLLMLPVSCSLIHSRYQKYRCKTVQGIVFRHRKIKSGLFPRSHILKQRLKKMKDEKYSVTPFKVKSLTSSLVNTSFCHWLWLKKKKPTNCVRASPSFFWKPASGMWGRVTVLRGPFVRSHLLDSCLISDVTGPFHEHH